VLVSGKAGSGWVSVPDVVVVRLFLSVFMVLFLQLPLLGLVCRPAPKKPANQGGQPDSLQGGVGLP
jgi:hypothetical protein